MKDKELIELTLRLFKAEQIDEQYSIDTIMERYRNSKRFNFHNFSLGVSIGIFIGFIIVKYFVK